VEKALFFPLTEGTLKREETIRVYEFRIPVTGMPAKMTPII
jgi:hypothetical protein